MKKFPIILLSIALAQAARCVAAEPTPPLTAAVLDFQTSGDKLTSLGADAGQLLAAKLTSAPGLMLVERQEVDKLLGEIELGQGGVVTPGSAAKAGEMLGAQVLITGRIFQAGGKYYVVAKVIGVETSRVFGETAVFDEPGQLGAAVDNLAEQISKLSEGKKSEFTATVESEEDFLKRLAKSAGGKPLPKLAIVLPEEHLSRPVIDSAARTEIARLYEALGGQVATDPAAADVVIAGEAFSERGMQRGDLVSCRARIEIRISRKGVEIRNDRQAGGAVGLGEHVAAKEALEKVARKLLERDLPVIVGVER